MPGPPAPCSYGLAAVPMGYVIWTASNLQNGQLNRYDGDSWGVVRPLEPWNTVNTSLSGLQRGTLWVGGFQLQSLDTSGWRVYDTGNVPIPYHHTRLLEAGDGALWIAGLPPVLAPVIHAQQSQ